MVVVNLLCRRHVLVKGDLILVRVLDLRCVVLGSLEMNVWVRTETLRVRMRTHRHVLDTLLRRMWLVLLVNDDADLGLLDLLCFRAVGGVGDRVRSERDRSVLVVLMILGGVHHVSLVDSRFWCNLRQVMESRLEFADQTRSMSMVLLDIGVAVIDLRIFVECRLGGHEKLLRLGMMAEDQRRGSIILHGQIAAVLSGLHVLVSLSQSPMSVLETSGTVQDRTVLWVMDVCQLLRI